MSFEIIFQFSEVAYCMMLLTISCLCFITVVFVFSVIFYHRWSSSPLHANQQNTCSLATPQFSRPRDTSTLLRHYSLADTSLRQNSTFSVHLPEFWEFNVTGYFQSIELIFNDNNITSEISKYSHLIQALSKTTHILKGLTDIVRTTNNVAPYTGLKQALIERYTTTPSGCLQKILNDCHRGQTTVTAYLIQLRTLLGTQYDSNSPLQKDLIKHKLLESLDPHIRLYLNHYEDGPLDALAKHADKLLSLHNNSPSSKSLRSDHNDNQTLINESVNSSLQNLQRQLADISKIQTQSPNTTKENTHNALPCYYHQRFDNRARKCQGPPCPAFSNSGTPLSKKRGTCLHGLRGWRQDNIDKTPLFYVMDRITTTRFLVDTGAACSVIPQTIAGCGTSSHSSVQGNIFLSTIGGGRLITSGLFSTKLDVGFSRFFSFTFHVSSQLDYGILGADFLAHQLCVNVASQRLIENLEV